jgi:hypothetical protein
MRICQALGKLFMIIVVSYWMINDYDAIFLKSAVKITETFPLHRIVQ